ncbi:ornithine cyclodeaminase family protein [Streptomyces sp. WAC06614]|uniref:ornithine cyclodeaminase family protein n=1 Tax=Streptomyces sp. WAC06614 TaxID=2487416 RepID=UPI000F7AD95E|nr:ornithine cyclodeaminase family protein [Streptomyces sp. WAC06614]RSS54618.1 ornithine cyclodeaminase family protein [Streptomyces sp. WAC06614]
MTYRTLHAGRSDNPRKLTVEPPDGHSVSYAMLGRDGSRDIVAIKTSYKHGLDKGRAEQHYYTALTLYDDLTGLPVAMMDCSRIGSLRTPAVSALLARECAAPGARSALVVGTGTQGRLALPFLLTTLPELDRLMLFGTHPEGLAAVRAHLHAHAPGRELEIVTDLRAAAAEADVVVATAGAHTPAAVEADWLGPGALSVLVGHGLAPSTLHRADRVIATSAAQMQVTGTDMADAAGELRSVDAEFAPVLAGVVPGRGSDTERVFAYNSGLVVTDIALGHRFAQLALAQGLGTEVPLWR